MQRNDNNILLSQDQASTVAQAFFSLQAGSQPSVDATIKALESFYRPRFYQVTALNGGKNNKNFRIRDKLDALPPIIIQLCDRSIACDAAVAHLLSLKDKPNFFPKSTLQFRQAGDTAHIDNYNKNNRPVISRVACMTSMEHLTPLGDKIREVQDECKATRNYNQSAEFAANVGSQVSVMLSTLAKNNIIWTDFKAGNILLDKDNNIMITDYKGLVPVSMLETRSNGNAWFSDVSNGYLSSDFVNQREVNTLPNQALGVWEKEYSFQLARMLYHAATGKEFIREASAQTENVPEDDIAFKGEKGKKLLQIIKSLSAENPNDRMHHQDAAQLLALIKKMPLPYDDPAKLPGAIKKFNEAFDELYKKLESKKMSKVTQIVKEYGDKPLDPKVIGDVVAPQKYYEFAEMMKAEKKSKVNQNEPGYNYNIALNIYNIYAGNKPYTAEIDEKHPIFKGDKGKQLRSIISKMMDGKMNHEEAGQLLKKMAEETSLEFAKQPDLQMVAPKISFVSTNAMLYERIGTPKATTVAPATPEFMPDEGIAAVTTNTATPLTPPNKKEKEHESDEHSESSMSLSRRSNSR